MAEPRVKPRRPQVDDPAKELAEWLVLLDDLVVQIRRWVEPDWTVEVVQKEMFDPFLGGDYEAPALLMQRGSIGLSLDPVARFTPGTDGVLELCVMPEFHDVAAIYRVGGEWMLRYIYRGGKVVVPNASMEPAALTAENLIGVLAAIVDHAA